MAIALASAILTAHKSIFDHLDEVFDHVDGIFGPKNTFLAIMALKAAGRTVNYRDVLKEMHHNMEHVWHILSDWVKASKDLPKRFLQSDFLCRLYVLETV